MKKSRPLTAFGCHPERQSKDPCGRIGRFPALMRNWRV